MGYNKQTVACSALVAQLTIGCVLHRANCSGRHPTEAAAFTFIDMEVEGSPAVLRLAVLVFKSGAIDIVAAVNIDKLDIDLSTLAEFLPVQIIT